MPVLGTLRPLGTAEQHQRFRTNDVVVDERTTIAAGYALALFTERAQRPAYPGERNAATVSHSPADIGTGKIAKALATAPNDHLVLCYVSYGRSPDGPGNITFDALGNARIPGAPCTGGGLYGAGFGMAQDAASAPGSGDFGFQGTGCGLDAGRFYRNVSPFTPDGQPASPPTGWRQGDNVQPQGVVSQGEGTTIWHANYGGQWRPPAGGPRRRCWPRRSWTSSPAPQPARRP
ncbi:hypothetical protein [Streptomyces sp. NPDC058701]|uniref:hypothetical protein n=1 Tax=Streptomyces sp. NPDC058701 TaxID=3346608 RepID=UPI003667231C